MTKKRLGLRAQYQDQQDMSVNVPEGKLVIDEIQYFKQDKGDILRYTTMVKSFLKSISSLQGYTENLGNLPDTDNSKI